MLHVDLPKLALGCQVQSFEQQLVNKHFEIWLAGTNLPDSSLVPKAYIRGPGPVPEIEC